MQKKSLVLIICAVVAILAIVLLVIFLVGGGSIGEKDIIKTNISSVQPDAELSLEPTDTTDGTVTIYINASISGGNSIESITLPNGQVVTSEGAKYEVSKNGEYSFIINGSNGSTVTKSITVDNINEISADSPYIPEGFEHVSGTTVENGFIIEDSEGNQFVWVPVETGSLIRNTDGDEKYEEIDNTATGLYNSVVKYYGFYIARYESSKNEVDGLAVAKSVENEMPWSNLTYEEAYSACINASNVYGYSGVKTALMNSYAWDTALNWMNSTVTNYSSNTSYGNYSGIILKSGTTEMDQVNSICDMAGNLREWTTEVYYPELPEVENEDSEIQNTDETEASIEEDKEETYRVVRGGSANINKVANSHIGQPESLSDVYWGFRMVLYKD